MMTPRSSDHIARPDKLRDQCQDNLRLESDKSEPDKATPENEQPMYQRDQGLRHPGATGNLIKMAAMGLHQIFAFKSPSDEGESDVKEDAHQHQRHEKRPCSVTHEEERSPAQQEAARLTADITHEDPRFGIIEVQERQRRDTE